MTSQAQYLDRYAAALLPVFGRPQLVLTRGAGSSVWDADGKEYLDLLAGIAVNALGHGHPALVAAVRRGLVAERATMVLDGGELEVAWAGEGPVRMTGPYAISFSGSFDPATIGRRA